MYIYAFVSNLTILTFSKVMDQQLLGGGTYGLIYHRGGGGSGLAQVGDKFQMWWAQKFDDTMSVGFYMGVWCC